MPQLVPELYAEMAQIIDELEPEISKLYSKAQNFVGDQVARKKEYGERMFMSPAQMKWLRDLHEEFVGTAVAQKDQPRELSGKDFAGRRDMDDDIPF